MQGHTCIRESQIFIHVSCFLQEMRSYLDAEQAGKDAGLILLRSYDVATQSSVAGAWYVLLADSHLFRICELLTLHCLALIRSLTSLLEEGICQLVGAIHVEDGICQLVGAIHVLTNESVALVLICCCHFAGTLS